ncbi:hypothetical protein [Paenibacillus sp. V4I7]|uniref:hypothetical protein n=1 Tax=Paenibacillus sp. V4I7 TaxID=3042307 RepID=UPI00277DB3A2|nr:hypothetical protein [Paenibacillus sp. V4I7]MDQ0896977.1 hypothetical protein [Paenibacillus sp. V4I7]
MKRPLKVLSTSIGIMLVSHMLLLSAHAAESPNPSAVSKLVEWSSEDVKAYYDPSVDWSLPVPVLSDNKTTSPSPSPTPEAGGSSTGFGGMNQITGGGGFGWDDLLLYHLIFNTVSPYSSSSWGSNHRSYHYRSNTPYVTKTYQPNSFSNRSTTKTPTTSSGTGSFTTNKSSSNSASGGTTSSSKSTSTSSSSIGGKSSGFSSSSSSSSGG